MPRVRLQSDHVDKSNVEIVALFFKERKANVANVWRRTLLVVAIIGDSV